MLRNTMSLSFVALCLSLLVVCGCSFVTPGGRGKYHTIATAKIIRQPQILFSTDPEKTENDTELSEGVQLADVNAVSTTDTPTSIPTEESDPYPIDLPSPLLLASSMILTIAGVGSIFDLTGANEPNLGFGTTAAIAAVSIPVGLFLFYASILKATAETEEDDRDYLRK